MNIGIWVKAAVGFAVVLTMGLMAGCEGSSDDPDVPGADPQAAFAVTEPQTGSTVDGEVITLKGVGLAAPATMEVSVFTDRWYDQQGSLHISDNNSWSYGPVYLGGSGPHNNHTIRARAMRSDGAVDTAEVRGIMRD